MTTAGESYNHCQGGHMTTARGSQKLSLLGIYLKSTGNDRTSPVHSKNIQQLQKHSDSSNSN